MQEFYGMKVRGKNIKLEVSLDWLKLRHGSHLRFLLLFLVVSIGLWAVYCVKINFIQIQSTVPKTTIPLKSLREIAVNDDYELLVIRGSSQHLLLQVGTFTLSRFIPSKKKIQVDLFDVFTICQQKQLYLADLAVGSTMVYKSIHKRCIVLLLLAHGTFRL